MAGLILDTVPADGNLSLDNTPLPPSQPVAQNRAMKADIGLGGIVGQDYNSIYQQITGGQEDLFRQGAAAQIDYKSYEQRQQALTELARQKGRELTLDEVQETLTGTPTNSDTVIEKAYSQAYINKLKEAADRTQSPVLSDADVENPEAVKRYFDTGSTILSRLEYLRTQAENLSRQAEEDTWLKIPLPSAVFGEGAGINIGSRSHPIANAANTLANIATLGNVGTIENEWLMRGNIPGVNKVFTANILQGDNLRAQALELLRQPSDVEFKQLADKAIDHLKYWDPAAAAQWAHSMAGMSTDEMIVNDAMSAINLIGLAGAARTVKGWFKGAGSTPGTTRPNNAPPPSSGHLTLGPDGVYRPASPNTEAALKAVDDVLKSSPASPTKANIAEAAGDLHEAAVQKTIQSVETPNPAKDATDTLLSLHRQQTKQIEYQPGNLSREAHTRMLDASEGFDKDLVDVIQNTAKVVRDPIITEEGFRSVSDDMKQYFRGKDNTILDVEHFHDHVTNTDHFRFTLGNYDGGPFTSKLQALNHAEINGYGKAKVIGQEPDTVYIPKVAVFKTDYTKPNAPTIPHPEFHIEEKNGQTRFILGEGEVLPRTTPQPGDLSYNLKTKKFGTVDLTGPNVVQKGLGFYIQTSVPFDETQPFAINKLLGQRTRSRSSDMRKMSFGYADYLRLPADTLSHAENENRVKVVYSQNRYLDVMQKQMDHIRKVYGNRKEWPDFLRALTLSQKYPDPETKLPGYFFKTPLEIQDFWLRTFGRMPSENEQAAYLAVQRINHADLVYRSISVYKNKSRLGVMDHKLISYKDGKKVSSTPFEGRMITTVPSTDRVVAIHESDGSIKLLNAYNTENRKQFINAFKQGQYRGIQLYDPDEYPLKVFDKDGNHVRVGYVFSKSVESSPISYNQIQYRGGGHWDYNYDRFIKYPIVRTETVGGKVRKIYAGDATFAPIRNNDVNLLGKLNQVVELLEKKKIAEAKALHQSFMDQPWKDFVRHFYPRKNKSTGELDPARFPLGERFRIVPKGSTILATDKKLADKYKSNKFIDTTRQESLAKNFQVEFTGARDSHDLFEPNNVGTVSNPMYKFEPAELVDPMLTMQRSMARIVNSMYMDDYKISAIQHWIEENKDMLDNQSRKLLHSSPYWVFENGKLDKNNLRAQTAESNRYKIKKLVGTPTKWDTFMHSVKQAMADEIFQTDSKIKKTFLIPAEWTLQNLHKGPNFVRGMAFHQNLGFWNWMQLAAQNAAYINFVALSPEHALPGIFGAWMHLWSETNSRIPILKHLGTLAEKVGGHTPYWKPGEWEEARQHYINSGFGKIANTLALDYNKKDFGLSNLRKWSRRSTVFFDLAEQNVRHGAWYTAFHEFKRAYPTRKIGEPELGMILRRANDMYMNMGRDSRTILNTGVLSMTLQFFKYQENVGHLFFSNRIGDVFGKENTWQLRARQRAQMIAMYALAFGPLGATGLSLLPVNDMVRKQALANGYIPGENALSTLLMEGPASMAGAYLSGWYRTGKLDMSKGTFYNFNDRYGANGYQVIRDLLENNNTFWGVLLGASGSTFANNLASLSPFVYAMKSAWNDEADNPFRITHDMWFDGLRNINSMRYAERFAYAMAYGEWLDRHGRTQQDIGKVDAIFRTLLGVNDQKIDDDYLKRQVQQDEREIYKKAAQDYLHYMQLGRQAYRNGDEQQAIAYHNDALFALKSRHVPSDEASKIIASEVRSLNKTLDNTDYSFYNKLVPTDSGRGQEQYRQLQEQKR